MLTKKFISKERQLYLTARARYTGTRQQLSITAITSILRELEKSIALTQNSDSTKLDAKKLYLDIIREHQNKLQELLSPHYLTTKDLMKQYTSILELGQFQTISTFTQSCIEGVVNQLRKTLVEEEQQVSAYPLEPKIAKH